MHKKLMIMGVGLAAVLGFTTIDAVHAAGKWQGAIMRGNHAMMRPSVVGTVSAVSGANITVNGRQGFGTNASVITYNIDASTATVLKNNATSTISSIVVGDAIAVQGTINGTNVTATTIREDRKSTRLNSSHSAKSRMPSSA